MTTLPASRTVKVTVPALAGPLTGAVATTLAINVTSCAASLATVVAFAAVVVVGRRSTVRSVVVPLAPCVRLPPYAVVSVRTPAAAVGVTMTPHDDRSVVAGTGTRVQVKLLKPSPATDDTNDTSPAGLLFVPLASVSVTSAVSVAL